MIMQSGGHGSGLFYFVGKTFGRSGGGIMGEFLPIYALMWMVPLLFGCDVEGGGGGNGMETLEGLDELLVELACLFAFRL